MAECKLSAQEIELGIKKLLNFKKEDPDLESNATATEIQTNTCNSGSENSTKQDNDKEGQSASESGSLEKTPENVRSGKKARKRLSKAMESGVLDMCQNDEGYELEDVEASASSDSVNHELRSSDSAVLTFEGERKILKAKRHRWNSQGDETTPPQCDGTTSPQGDGTTPPKSGQGVDRDRKTNEKENGIEEPVTNAVKKFWDIPVKKEKKKKTKKNKGDDTAGGYLAKDKSESVQKDGADVAGSKKLKSTGNKEERKENEAKKAGCSKGTQSLSELSPQALVKVLEEDRIFPLKKKSTRFPQAKFFCRLCDYHMDTPNDCDRHMKDNRHKRRIEINQIEQRLERLPAVTPDQTEAINKLLDSILDKHALKQSERDYRVKVTRELEVFLQKSQSDICVVLYGSSQTGIGLQGCDVNMDLLVKGSQSQAQALTKALKTMKDSDEYTNVRSDFSAKVPCIYFSDRTGELACQLTITGSLAPQTTNLLTIYADMDPRVRKLGIVFRYFAKICRIDRQDEGTLPAYCFALLTVYYLQKCKPAVLPVLDLGIDEEETKSPTKRKKTPPPDEVNFGKIREMGERWHTDNTLGVGALWLDMLRFYCLEFDNAQYVVCLRQEKFLTRSDKKWNTKRIAIEDPFSNKRNAARSVTNYEVFQYIWDCFRKSYFYFSMPTNYNQLTVQQQNVLEKTRLRVKAEKAAKEALQQKRPNSKDSEKEICDVDRKEESDDNADVIVESSEEEDLEEEDEKLKSEKDGSCEKEVMRNSCRSRKRLDLSVKSVEVAVPEGSVKASNVDSDNLCSDHEPTQQLDPTQSEALSQTESSEATDGCEQCGINKVQSTVDTDQKSVAVGDKLDDTKDLLANALSDLSLKDPRDVPPDIDPEESLVKTCESLVLDDKNVCEEKHSDDETQILKETIVDSKPETSDLIEEKVELIEESVVDSMEKLSESNRDTVDVTSEIVETDKSRECEDSTQGSKEQRTEVSSSENIHMNLEFDFEFQEKRFTDGKGPLIICSICEKEGHLKNSCPDEALPDLKPLPEMTKDYLRVLSNTIKQVPRDFGVNRDEYEDREDIRLELEEFIQELYPDAELHLFGSSHNGLGFKQSDLDLCVTFQGRDTSDGLDPVDVIEDITKKLKKHRGLYNVFSITTAKVPIVKFKHRRSKLEGDISLYNLLALYNTKMVQLYASLDPRVRCLGYAIKVFAKVCEIGDASRGSLSSYAYVLLLIYYLQQCKPAILPVLQELYPGRKPERIVDGWNTWYFDEVDTLPKIWRCRNQQSLGELWFGLFIFYTELFNIKDNVVCIRLSEPLTRFEKLWNGKCIAIEDPFDLSHNLGGGLSRKMNQYIMKTFIRGRELYGTPRDIPNNFKTDGDYLFDKSQLSQGAPPSDRCCRVCNKIGHIAKECPRVLQRKEKEEREKFKNFRTKDRKGQREDSQRNEGPSHYDDRNMSQGQHTKGMRKSDAYDAEVEDDRRYHGNAHHYYNSNMGQRFQQHHPASQPRNIPVPFHHQGSPGQRQYQDVRNPRGNYHGNQRPAAVLSDSYPPPRQTVSPMKQGRDPLSSPKLIGRSLSQDPYLSTSPQKGTAGHPWMNQYMPTQQQRMSHQQQQQQQHQPQHRNHQGMQQQNQHPQHQRQQGMQHQSYPNSPLGSSNRQVSMAANQGGTGGHANIGVSIPNELYQHPNHPGNQGGANQRQSYKQTNQQRRK